MVKKKKSPVPKLVVIEWLDHASLEDGWIEVVDVPDRLQPVQIASVGWAYDEDETYVTLLSTVTKDGGTRAPQLILKADIIRTVVLENPLEELYDAVHREGTPD